MSLNYSDIDDFDPVTCLLCGNEAETPEEHNAHMEEYHQ